MFSTNTIRSLEPLCGNFIILGEMPEMKKIIKVDDDYWFINSKTKLPVPAYAKKLDKKLVQKYLEREVA